MKTQRELLVKALTYVQCYWADLDFKEEDEGEHMHPDELEELQDEKTRCRMLIQEIKEHLAANPPTAERIADTSERASR